jgi:hypothetical protein
MYLIADLRMYVKAVSVRRSKLDAMFKHVSITFLALLAERKKYGFVLVHHEMMKWNLLDN